MISQVKFLVIGAAIALVACGQTSAQERINLQSEELLEQFASRLEDRNIWYEVTGPKSLEVKKHDHEQAVELLFATAEDFLPSGRSFSFEAESCQKKFTAALEGKGIEYELRISEGREWVIWQEADANVAERIRNEVILEQC